jgi:hypothetical protein
MRRPLYIAAFVLTVALLPARAQMRGGGRVSGGGHGGFSGHVGGGHAFGGGRAFGGGHAFGGMQRGPSLSGRGFNRGSSFRQPSFHQPFHRQTFQHPGFSGRGGFHHRGQRFRTFGFRNCFGCRRSWGWPGWYAGYYDPYWWWDSGSSYDEDREREIRLANEMNAQSLEEQRMLREEDQDLYAPSDAPASREAQATETPTPATVLIFRDQHKQEVQNYAIVGSTLWVFGPQRTQKIPVAELDVPATAKANDERGVEFRVPGESQGQ